MTARTVRATGSPEGWGHDRHRPPGTAIEVQGLHRRYGPAGSAGFDAVRGLDLSVRRGELFALLGTNGAGKTSTMELIEGLAVPTAGQVWVLGDVAVLDLQMPGLDGIGVAAELRRILPDCRTMIVTGHGRPGYLKRALEVGVRGFLPKTVSASDLAGIIRTVRAGDRYIDPELAADAISSGDSPDRFPACPGYGGLPACPKGARVPEGVRQAQVVPVRRS